MTSQQLSDGMSLKGIASFNYQLSLACLLFIKALVLVGAIMYAGIGLGPDEAQYWLWSKNPDWAYYSKPPGIAWEILLGTSFFGATELGVRFGALVIGFILPIAVYMLASNAGLKPVNAFWAGAAMALSPMGILASFFATTDAGYILFWTLACVVIVRGLRNGETPNYLILGLLIAAGALFKWPIYFLWVFVLLFAALVRPLRSPMILFGMLVSLLGLLPSFLWNRSHDWVTFRHVWGNMFQHPVNQTVPVGGNFWDFLGAQIALLSPVFFVLLVLGYIALWRKRTRVGLPLIFCGLVSFTLLIVYLAVSLGQKMQGNWALFAYPTGIVVICWYAGEYIRNGRPWLFWGSVLSALLTLFVFSIPSIQSQSILPSVQIPYSVNPFRHNVGWTNLELALKDQMYEPDHYFLFSDRYQTAAIMSFYSEGQQRAYVMNLLNARKSQFSFWPSLAHEQLNNTGFFAYIESNIKSGQDPVAKSEELAETLRPYFREVNFIGFQPLFTAYGEIVKGALLFQCVDYNGLLPPDPDVY